MQTTTSIGAPRKKRQTVERWLSMPGKFSNTERWSEKDILHLERGLTEGRTLKEIADALGRDIDDVRQMAAALGNGVPLAPRLWPPTS
jgi:hypothetical protein